MSGTLRERRGTTLVELVVSMLLLSIFLLAATSLIRPCAEIFLRMQNLSRAQMISDTMVDYLQGQLLHAQGTLRLCDTGYDEDSAGAVFQTAAAANGSRGTAVEFQVSTNVDRDENDVGRGDRAAAYKLIDGGYVPRTAGTRAAPGGVPAPVFETPLAAGTLHERYYMPGKNGEYLYKNAEGAYCAYAGTDAFPEGFYMGMAVRLEFTVYSWMPRKTTDPVRVTALDVKVEVYASEQDAENGAAPLHSRRAILDLADAPRLVQGSSPAAAA